MKKIFISLSISSLLLTSCSIDDNSTYELNKQKYLVKPQKNEENFCITCRDSLTRENDSIPTEPTKPIKP